ncbi:HDOD domain-containing protein [Denitromonas halophila]|uniref:HDOD domain-containing protein n=1 Tax=Denitromonas halophila TaxID=1629404 RepID=A0A557QKC7_9RHOO|nr:HDOD domain-containing protein [Denitromonas halophila]TVO53354.1 HDOD domain-containing protein [Denitromonas halophila]
MSTSLEIQSEDPFENALDAFSRTIENDLATRQLTFPTFLDLTIRIKRVCDDPQASLDDIICVIRADPLLSARIIRLANSVALNPYNRSFTSISEAVRRVGLVNVRSLAYAVATEQLAAESRSADARLVASGLWMHTIDVASWSYAITRHLRIGDPDTALFAGMLSSIGQFYLLARATAHPVLEQDLNRLGEFIGLWHEPVSRALLGALEVPKTVIDIFDDGNPYGGQWPPVELRDVHFIAGLSADTPNPFLRFNSAAKLSLLEATTQTVPEQELSALRADARDSRNGLLAALRG